MFTSSEAICIRMSDGGFVSSIARASMDGMPDEWNERRGFFLSSLDARAGVVNPGSDGRTRGGVRYDFDVILMCGFFLVFHSVRR